MKLHRRSFLHLSAGTAALTSLTRSSKAQDGYPLRPVRLVVGFTPGAASDITARLFAKGAAPVLGQQVAVENKPGAAGSVAGQYVVRAAKDGYTLFLFALSTLTNEIINPTPSFDVVKDFAPIALLANGAIVLAVNPATKVHSVAELIALPNRSPENSSMDLLEQVASRSLPQSYLLSGPALN
ncbi:MAG: tripartite tricarboxylate transporter substrate-binding protein [Xanthobacteraceae bacterium]